MFVLWVIVGLGVGWAGGRLLAPTRIGVRGDLVAGLLGSLFTAWWLQTAQAGGLDGSLVALLGGSAGALAATFVHRAYTDRYRRLTI